MDNVHVTKEEGGGNSLTLEREEKDIKEIMERTTSSVVSGLYCEMDLHCDILQANHRLDVLRKHCVGRKRAVSEGSFLNFVPSYRRKEVVRQITDLGKDKDFRGTLSIPLQVENFEYGVKAQIKFFQKKVVLLIPNREMDKLQSVELIRIKALIEKKSHMGLWILDSAGIVRDVIEGNAVHNLGWTAREVIGMNYSTFIQQEQEEFQLKDPHKEGVYKILRRHKSEESIATEVVIGQIKLHDGRRYTAHLDYYENWP